MNTGHPVPPAGGFKLRFLGANATATDSCYVIEGVAVNAEVVQLSAASAHADAGEILDWLRAAPSPPHA